MINYEIIEEQPGIKNEMTPFCNLHVRYFNEAGTIVTAWCSIDLIEGESESDRDARKEEAIAERYSKVNMFQSLNFKKTGTIGG